MFSLERNGVRPYRECIIESWHQTVPHSSSRTHNPDRYKWGDINALFEDQVHVTFNHLARISDSKAKTKQIKRSSRLLGGIQLKRLSKPRIIGRRLDRFGVPHPKCSSKVKRLSLKLEKRGIPAAYRLQDIKKKLKMAIGTVAAAHK